MEPRSAQAILAANNVTAVVAGLVPGAGVQNESKLQSAAKLFVGSTFTFVMHLAK